MDFRLAADARRGPGRRPSPTGRSATSELAPYYDRVEQEIGVSGNAVPHPFAEPRNKPYPLPPLDEHPMAGEIDRRLRQLGVPRRSPPRAASSAAPYRRPRRLQLLRALRQLRLRDGAKCSTHASLIPEALRHRQASSSAPGCMAREIEV